MLQVRNYERVAYFWGMKEPPALAMKALRPCMWMGAGWSCRDTARTTPARGMVV